MTNNAHKNVWFTSTLLPLATSTQFEYISTKNGWSSWIKWITIREQQCKPPRTSQHCKHSLAIWLCLATLAGIHFWLVVPFDTVFFLSDLWNFHIYCSLLTPNILSSAFTTKFTLRSIVWNVSQQWLATRLVQPNRLHACHPYRWLYIPCIISTTYQYWRKSWNLNFEYASYSYYNIDLHFGYGEFKKWLHNQKAEKIIVCCGPSVLVVQHASWHDQRTLRNLNSINCSAGEKGSSYLLSAFLRILSIELVTNASHFWNQNCVENQIEAIQQKKKTFVGNVNIDRSVFCTISRKFRDHYLIA